MPRLTLVAALMALCLLVPRLPAQPAGGLPAPDALPAPEAPAEEAAPPWTVEQAAEALATIEGALDPQRHGYVRSQYYDHGSGRIELCGFVASPDDLATAKSAVEGAMGVVNVDVTNVVIVGESPRRPESALKKVVSYLQDGRHYDDIRDESRAMIASPDPRMRAAGLVFSSISYLEEKDPIRGCGYLRVASQVDPVLLDSDQLRGFFAYDQFSDLMRMPDETWNTDIVNPYFVPASKLPSFLRSVESLTALASLVVVPPPPPEPLPPPQPGMPAPSIAAAPGELPPADLPADVAPAPGAPSAAPGDLPAGPPSATPGAAAPAWHGGGAAHASGSGYGSHSGCGTCGGSTWGGVAGGSTWGGAAYGWPPGFICPATYQAFDWSLGWNGSAWPGPCPWCPGYGPWYPNAVWVPTYWHVPMSMPHHAR
jgi:hypothetical protein